MNVQYILLEKLRTMQVREAQEEITGNVKIIFEDGLAVVVEPVRVSAEHLDQPIDWNRKPVQVRPPR